MEQKDIQKIKEAAIKALAKPRWCNRIFIDGFRIDIYWKPCNRDFWFEAQIDAEPFANIHYVYADTAEKLIEKIGKEIIRLKGIWTEGGKY